ncbi:hypothetical protein HOY82DRAFT_640590 [Tuber indicum]|nr:hypothetical protein HOY82DRAFT_640590 [Tuber indicum]
MSRLQIMMRIRIRRELVKIYKMLIDLTQSSWKFIKENIVLVVNSMNMIFRDQADKAGKIKAIPLFEETVGTVFHDWNTSLAQYLKPLNGIQSFQFFHFSATSPGIVHARRLPDQEWIKFDLRKSFFSLDSFHQISPPLLPNIGMNPEKRHDLWHNRYISTVLEQLKQEGAYGILAGVSDNNGPVIPAFIIGVPGRSVSVTELPPPPRDLPVWIKKDEFIYMPGEGGRWALTPVSDPENITLDSVSVGIEGSLKGAGSFCGFLEKSGSPGNIFGVTATHYLPGGGNGMSVCIPSTVEVSSRFKRLLRYTTLCPPSHRLHFTQAKQTEVESILNRYRFNGNYQGIAFLDPKDTNQLKKGVFSGRPIGELVSYEFGEYPGLIHAYDRMLQGWKGSLVCWNKVEIEDSVPKRPVRPTDASFQDHSLDGRPSWGHEHEGVVKQLLERRELDPEELRKCRGRTISYDIFDRREQVWKTVPTGGLKPDKPDNYNLTPLTFAAWNGHEGVVKMLLGLISVSPDNPNDGGRTPLSYAAEVGHEGVVKILLTSEEVNPDEPDNEGRTPLSFAENRREGVVRVLLGRAEINHDKPDNGGRTPLSYATSPSVITLLLC